MKDLILGDLTLKDDGDLGLSVYHRMRDMKKLLFLNVAGEKALLQWLEEKYGTD